MDSYYIQCELYYFLYLHIFTENCLIVPKMKYKSILTKRKQHKTFVFEI